MLTNTKLSSRELDVIIASIFKICVHYGISGEEVLKEYATTIHQIKTGTK